MRYLVLGAGALGSVFGGLLARKGHDVSFVGMDDHLRAMQQKGLRITGIWGESYIEKIHAYYGVRELDGTYDIVFFSVKSYLTKEVIKQVLPFIHKDTLVFSIQNGLGNWESIAEAVGWERTIGARIIFGAEISEPGTARVTVYADKVFIGSPAGEAPSERIKKVCRHLNDAGIPTDTTNEIYTYIWGKVLYNSALNPLGAILNVPYGFLKDVPEIRELIQKIIQEIFAVAKAKGVRLSYESPEEYYRFLMDTQLPPTSTHRSSMLQDMEKGRLTEIDSLNGAISRYGRELNIPTPANDVLTKIIKAIEEKNAQGV